jgi:hypothetical protein
VETDDLIRGLAEATEPVRRLPAPWRRMLVWLAAGLFYLVIVVLLMSPRNDLAQRMADPRFLIEQLGALATAIAAAAGALALTIPGQSRRFLIVALVPLAIWMGTLGVGCVRDWFELGPDGLMFHPDWACFPAMALVGLVPAIIMVLMLRRGAPLYPHTTVALGALAVAALGDFGLRLFHPEDGSLMVLVWQFGSAVVMSTVAAWAGRHVLRWRYRHAS